MRREIIAAARAWADTPFHHQGRVKGAGVDCVGLALMVGKELGLVDAAYDYNCYRRMPYGSTLIDAIRNSGFVDEVKIPQPGDILVFRIDAAPEHVALFSDTNTLIHAYAPAKKVTEARYDSQWKSRFITAFQFKGIDPWQY